MMDFMCSPQSFSRSLRILRIPLIFLLTVTFLTSVTGTKSMSLSGEIGGEVTFPCFANTNQRGISFVYLQKGNSYVNGYHEYRTILTPKWENTRLDQEKNVHMSQLNASHAGQYTCHIQYTGNTNIEEKYIQLNITANYTTPNVTKTCSDTDQNCKVTCTSYGGYPKRKMSWDDRALGNASAQMWNHVENPPECDTKTKLCNISSTATFNCSSMPHKVLSCYINETEISSRFSICDKPLPPTASPESSSVPIIACVIIVVIVLVVGFLVMCKIKKRHRGHRSQMTRQESNVEEAISFAE